MVALDLVFKVKFGVRWAAIHLLTPLYRQLVRIDSVNLCIGVLAVCGSFLGILLATICRLLKGVYQENIFSYLVVIGVIPKDGLAICCGDLMKSFLGFSSLSFSGNVS